MKYLGMPMAMWDLFHASFTRQLTATLGQTETSAKETEKAAKQEYRRIIARLPAFESGDRFQMNIVNCAMLGAYVLHMPVRPNVAQLTDYYAKAMMTPMVRWFCRKIGKSKFSAKDVENMRRTEQLRAADRNPYSWNMTFLPYADDSGYEARFSRCGICALMKELGLYDLTPAMCHLDYAMTEAGETADFVRQYTLASGGPYCDCGYKKKQQ